MSAFQAFLIRNKRLCSKSNQPPNKRFQMTRPATEVGHQFWRLSIVSMAAYAKAVIVQPLQIPPLKREQRQ
jgi:hypothetical protein